MNKSGKKLSGHQTRHSSIAFGGVWHHESETLLIVQTRPALGGLRDKKFVLTNSLVQSETPELERVHIFHQTFQSFDIQKKRTDSEEGFFIVIFICFFVVDQVF